mgnify:CR=1 FL=1
MTNISPDLKRNLAAAARNLRALGREESFLDLFQYSHCIGANDEERERKILRKRINGVTIIIPTYKGYERISRTLNSILSQNEARSRFEVIVVSNGPMDGTENIVNQYKTLNPDLRISFIRSEVASAAIARNVGLQHAAFAYCTFLDDDDFISPAFVSTLLNYAQPDRILLSEVVDFDEAERKVSAITLQARRARQIHQSMEITRLNNVSGILSMTCAKLAPTSALLRFDFDGALRSGEDVIFWAQVVLNCNLSIFFPEESSEAIYYREIRSGSVSRRETEFEFSVSERLQVLSRLEGVEQSISNPLTPAAADFIKSRYAGQIGFITRYLSNYKDKYSNFLDSSHDLKISSAIVEAVNDHLADTVVISYCFPPYNDTSALVMMKRLLSLEWPVHVISNNMSSVRDLNPSLKEVICNRIASHHEISEPATFNNGPGLQKFADISLEIFQKISKQRKQKKIFSRAMWPGSFFASALIKAKHPEIHWTAEFSDPLLLDIHGKERQGDISQDWITSTGIREHIGDVPSEHLSNGKHLKLFMLAELLPYAMADEIIFTNENQRNYMLSQPWAAEVRQRAMSVSKILPQPTLPEGYYALGKPSIAVNRSKTNIGFFGTFYPTRGLKEVLLALYNAPSSIRDAVSLHIVSPNPEVLRDTIAALNLETTVMFHGSLLYFDCLASFGAMDYLLVNDAVTIGSKSTNPYLPSKISDYLGSGRPIWALVEPGSPLSQLILPAGSISSTLGNETDALFALREMVSRKLP